jgi:hypothetical protein
MCRGSYQPLCTTPSRTSHGFPVITSVIHASGSGPRRMPSESNAIAWFSGPNPMLIRHPSWYESAQVTPSPAARPQLRAPPSK